MLTKLNVGKVKDLLSTFSDELDIVINVNGKPLEINTLRLGSFDIDEVEESIEKPVLCVVVSVSDLL